ncbi:alkaline phosphatase [Pseudoroseomonas deserti]|uniref:Alkaline phosphatase n=1 Tax=Teichococcus deserti TaxID=1817963 RepID=A0A1V2H508_9PROT|nr:alkaline phosphatase [Pseudoroseomonas deserti]ONG54269.1 alkaline phosphatase [Pseudoroseomonas deserti]
MRRLLATTALLGGLVAGLLPGAASAQTIFPINRAEILAGSRFDVKVEFAGVVARDALRVTLNGKPLDEAFGKAAEFVEREDGQAASSLVLRDAVLATPGRYVLQASDGQNTASVSWEVYAAPGQRRAQNVILFVGDGMTVANVTAARILSRGIEEGRYRSTLAMDNLPRMATVGTSGSDSIATDSANSAAAYNTGHKSAVNALNVYASRARGTLDHPKVETIASLVRRQLGMSIGIVTTAEIQDATPAAVFAHTRRRNDYIPITDQLLAAQPEVVMGGGSASFLPRSTPGSRRADERNMIDAFRQAGYVFGDSAESMTAAAADPNTRRLLGLFNLGNMDGALDRFYLRQGTVGRFPNQPDLTEQTRAALQVLSRNPAGFFLMVESGSIDKFNHPLDWERSVYETIMLDNALKVALDWAANRDDTLIVVVPDHNHGMSITGTVDDNRPGTEMREKVGVYEQAGFPNYPAADARGYPPRVDVSRRLAVFFANFPDYYETFRPHLEGPNVPAVAQQGQANRFMANERYREANPGGLLREGNIPRSNAQAVHTVDDVILRATGPGSERFQGFVDNTMVFRAMAEALGLGR